MSQVSKPTVIDRSAAPDGKKGLTILISAGIIDEKKDLAAIYQSAREMVAKSLEHHLKIENFENLIEFERTWSC